MYSKVLGFVKYCTAPTVGLCSHFEKWTVQRIKNDWKKELRKGKLNTCENTEIWAEVTLTSESVSNNKKLRLWQWLSKYTICTSQEYQNVIG